MTIDFEKAAIELYQKLEEDSCKSDDLAKFIEIMTAVSRENQRVSITGDDIEWFRVLAFLLKKVEKKEKGEDYRINGGEWRDIGADFEKLHCMVEELDSIKAINQLNWFMGGGAFYTILDTREFKRLIFRKGIHRLKDMEVIVVRQIDDSKKTEGNKVNIPLNYEYDIVVSFAGEDREIVRQYCDVLISTGLRVFYDEYGQVKLWGENLYEKLIDIYQNKASFCVIFISQYYAEKVWTKHELQSAQARALEESRPYILPVKLDNTDISGIPSTTSYIDLNKVTIDKLAEMTMEKIMQFKTLKDV